MEYIVEIEEILQKRIRVIADSEEEAIEMARDLYHTNEEVLYPEDLKETNFEIIKEEVNDI